MSEQVTLHHTGFILGVPGEYSPGHYIVENGQIVEFSPLAAPSLELEAATGMLQIAAPGIVVTEVETDESLPVVTDSSQASTTIIVTGTDASGNEVSETIKSDLNRAPTNNGG